MKTSFFLAGLLFLASGCHQNTRFDASFNIVPQPVALTKQGNAFTIDGSVALVFQNVDSASSVKQYIETFFPKFFGQNLPVAGKAEKAIVFAINETPDADLKTEGYKLTVTEHEITVNANTPAGLVYGLQTLYQLAPAGVTADKPEKITIPGVAVTDYPRFEWRGSHRDVSRHFFDVAHIKKHLDLMALYKLNKFHWHLTDDHGWRLETDKYPKLTEIGAWSVDRSNVAWREGEPPKEGEPATYGGFYTKDEVRDVVAYAAQRGIEVIPEIEIPGHCSEILAAYPEFACDDFPYYVQIGPYWPPKAILCGGNDAVMVFLKEVLDEVADLFPSEYIHIGGDEAFKDNWKVCPKCQKRMKDLHLQNEEELQSWMIREVEKHVMLKGKKIIGWDEILEGGVTPSAVVMSWRGEKGGIEAARHGNYVIMTPDNFCYFNYYQADEETEPQTIGGYVPLEQAYAFDPVSDSLTAEQAQYIMGGQANLWAEFLFTPEYAEYMLLPRLLALSEAVWSPKENKEWDFFVAKLPAQKQRLAALNYNYCDKVAGIRKQ
ncbi:MAG: beta-N-acetylhexosaminidase [Prevotellaceae bacterium]|jgi:hexosaminidase|nr:beta-N-acetylhexosaminidase [Prevotellaceae bacterium]